MNKKINSIQAIGIIALCAFVAGATVALTALQIKNIKFIPPEYFKTEAQDETANWQTYTNVYYGYQIKYPNGYKANDVQKACMEDIIGRPCQPSDFIGPGIKIVSLAPYDKLTNPDNISICYMRGKALSGISFLGCTQTENINIGDKTFSRYVCDRDTDIVSYVNRIKNSQGDILIGKYTAGPYFNDAFYIQYAEVGLENRLVAIIINYKLGFDILTELKKYYTENKFLPPDISGITPDIWCYDAIIRNQPIIDNEEKIARQILSTFKFVEKDETVDWQTYRNEEYGYEVKYPNNWTYREYPDTKTGAGFRPEDSPNDIQFEYINIDVRNSVPDAEYNFDDYVKIAGIQEIQNYEKLNSIEKIVTKSGITGYKTTWIYIDFQGKTNISLPITYFNYSSSNNDHKTVQISLTDQSFESIYNQMLSTFKFID